jgi:integrase
LAREGYLDANPVTFTVQAEEKARQRLLSDQEIRIIWRALDDGPPEQFGAIIKLLLLTGARRTEIGGLRWDEIGDDLIILPEARTKGGREHLIPLSEPAFAILKGLPRRAMADGTPSDHVFGNGDGYQNWSRSKVDLDARIAKAGHRLAPWTLHDFRRSVSTALHDRLGIQPHVVEVLLGHVGGHKAGVAGTYNKALYIEERRRALERWGAHLMELVTGKPAKGKIVGLHGRRR